MYIHLSTHEITQLYTVADGYAQRNARTLRAYFSRNARTVQCGGSCSAALLLIVRNRNKRVRSNNVFPGLLLCTRVVLLILKECCCPCSSRQ